MYQTTLTESKNNNSAKVGGDLVELQQSALRTGPVYVPWWRLFDPVRWWCWTGQTTFTLALARMCNFFSSFRMATKMINESMMTTTTTTTRLVDYLNATPVGVETCVESQIACAV